MTVEVTPYEGEVCSAGLLAQRLEILRSTGLLDAPPTTSFDRFTRLAARILDAPTTVVSLIDAERQVFLSQRGAPEPFASAREAPLSMSLCKLVVEHAAELIIDDARDHPFLAYHPAVASLGVVSYAGVPLVVADHAIGALCAVDGAPRRWQEKDIEALRDLAALAVAEIEMRRAARTLAEQTALFQSVLEAMDDTVVVADRDWRPLFSNAAAARLMGSPDLDPALWDPDRGVFDIDGTTPVPLDKLPLARALRGESVRHVELVVRSPELGGTRVHSANAAPVRDPTGAIVAAVVVGRDITELKQAHRLIEEASIRDELTGLYNRRGLRELGTLQIRAAARRRQRLSLFYIDLNGMKAINDTHGHAAGDRAIAETAALMRSTFRAADIASRIGGDEFVVLAMDCDLEGEVTAIARFRAAIAQRNAREDLPFVLSASIGVTSYEPGSAPVSLDTMLFDADARMYEDKRQHRRRG